MANLTEVSQWESVIRQIENGEAATGGADGLANIQAKQLANRTKWLKDTYLPLSGGAMSGDITVTNDNSAIGLIGGTNGRNAGSLGVFGINNKSMGDDFAGCFSLSTATSPDNDYPCQLIGKMNKSLTWCSNDIAGAAIVAKSLGANGYVKYASGLIIQWGVALCDGGSKVTKVTLPLSFPANEYRTIICPMCTNAETTVRTVAAFDTNRTSDTFDIIGASSTYIEYIAIGR